MDLFLETHQQRNVYQSGLKMTSQLNFRHCLLQAWNCGVLYQVRSSIEVSGPRAPTFLSEEEHSRTSRRDCSDFGILHPRRL